MNKLDTLTVKELSFNINNKKIIEDFNYTFNLGNIYLIKGSNGAGKSTLLNLILGLYSNEYDGTILFNDINAKDLDIYELRKQNISIVEQEPDFIDFIIRDELYDSSINVNSFNSLVKKFDLKIDRFLSNLKNPIFSGGEKQKISLIKALTKESNLIVLDEPTSALDKESVSFLSKILLKRKETAMIFIVSHDKRLDNLADFTINL